MIGSWRGLVVACVVALGLASALVIDVCAGRARADRALLPASVAARATELVWDAPGRAALHAVREGESWMLRAGPSRGGGAAGSRAGAASVPASASAIRDVLAALRGARWHRRGDAGAVRGTLTVVAGGERHAIGFAAAIEGGAQRWLIIDGRGALVDAWVARALERDELSLRVTTPLAAAQDGATTVRLAREGATVAVRGGELIAPVRLMLAREVDEELRAVLAKVTVVRIPDVAIEARGLRVAIERDGDGDGDAAGDARAGAGGGGRVRNQDPIEVVVGDACPGASTLVAVSGSFGDGCIERDAANGIERVARRLAAPVDQLVLRRPIGGEPARVVLGDGGVLDVVAMRLGAAAADPARVAELLAALVGPAEVVARPAGPPTQAILVHDRAGRATTLELFAGGVLGRAGEPVALRVASGAWALLVRPSRALRDLTLWLEEATSIATLVVGDVRYVRGPVIGAWTRDGVELAAPAAAAVEAAVAVLAQARAVEDIGPIGPGPKGRVATGWLAVKLTTAPPTGEGVEHAFAIGAVRGASCPATVGDERMALPAALCRALTALAR